MTIKLTYQQVENAVAALEAFNPPVNLKTKLRLNRNLRRLLTVNQDIQHDKRRLTLAAVQDKSKRSEGPQGISLTAEELEKLQPEIQKLMKIETEVDDIHAIELFDGSGDAQPNDPDFSIDISKKELAIPNEILGRLVDVVFVG